MRHLYPLMLDVTERLVVIIGGGAVAVRKAKGLIAAGATRVRCVAPIFHADLPTQVERIPADYEPHHLHGATLVFAATDSPQVNEQVVRDARQRGALVNRADVDEDDPCDFTTPALWREGAVTITVSAGGSPALAAAIRDHLAANLDPLHLRMARAMQSLRPLVRRSPMSPMQRREFWRQLAGPDAVNILAQRGENGLLDWIKTNWPESEMP